MKVYYDIHIHSILSPCADDSQTPNNIFNMCMLKGLNLISICDHNSAKQYPTLELLKDSYDFLLIYGMEVEVKEGFHVLTYFDCLEKIIQFDKLIEASLDKSIPTFDEEIICDEYDEVNDELKYYLNQKSSYQFRELIELVHNLDGVIIPAHIDRRNSGILDYIDDLRLFAIDGIEVYNLRNYSSLVKKYPYLSEYKMINNSDSHSIDMINEAINYIELDDLSFASFKKWLKD